MAVLRGMSSHGKKGECEGCGADLETLRIAAGAGIAQGAKLVAVGIFAAECRRFFESGERFGDAGKQLAAAGRKLLGNGRGAGTAGNAGRGVVPPAGMQRRDVFYVCQGVSVYHGAAREAGRPGSVSGRRKSGDGDEMGPGAAEIYPEAD